MAVRTSTKAPTKTEIATHTRDDLREVYLMTFEQHAIIPSDVPIYTEDRINLRYARELLGVLTNAGLITVTSVNGEEDVWQTTSISIDDSTQEDAETLIDKWLDEKIPTTTATTSEGKTIKVAKAKAKPATTGTCLCGCGENVAKSNYRPGHDARHAGNVARAIATGGSRDLLATLPSEALRTKAGDMADRLLTKANAKAAKAAPTPPPVVLAKVGRTQYEGVVDGDEFHYVTAKGDEKSTTKFTLVN